MNICVRPALATDAEVIARIYNYYIHNTVITFEEEPVSGQTMAARLADVQNASLPWLVAELEGALVGYAYANKWKVRTAYRYSVGTTVYLEHGHKGRGIGKRLYSELYPSCEREAYTLRLAERLFRTKRVWLCMRSWVSSGSQRFTK